MPATVVSRWRPGLSYFCSRFAIFPLAGKGYWPLSDLTGPFGTSVAIKPQWPGLICDRGTTAFLAALRQMLLVSAYAGMGMSPSQLAARYRGYAAQCLILAQHHDSAADKSALIAMAQAWANLADYVDKNEALFAQVEVPVAARSEHAR